MIEGYKHGEFPTKYVRITEAGDPWELCACCRRSVTVILMKQDETEFNGRNPEEPTYGHRYSCRWAIERRYELNAPPHARPFTKPPTSARALIL